MISFFPILLIEALFEQATHNTRQMKCLDLTVDQHKMLELFFCCFGSGHRQTNFILFFINAYCSLQFSTQYAVWMKQP